MAFDSNGIYSLPPGYFVETGDTVLPSQHNPPFQDVAAALSQVLVRDGRAPMTGALDMGGFKVINVNAGTGANDLITKSQLDAVVAQIAANAVPTGAVQGFRRTSPPAGWILENGGTIGDAGSGATTRANSDAEALFTLLWNQFNNATLPIYDSAGAASSRGGSAAADFAAKKRLKIFDARTRFLRGSDSGLAFDAALTVGAEQDDAIKNHVHPFETDNGGGHNHTIPPFAIDNDGTGAFESGRSGGGNVNTSTAGVHKHSGTTKNNTGGNAKETRPRSSVVLYCIKL